MNGHFLGMFFQKIMNRKKFYFYFYFLFFFKNVSLEFCFYCFFDGVFILIKMLMRHFLNANYIFVILF